MNNQQQIETIRQWLGSGSINLFGLPFAGKDSQGARLAELLGGKLLGGGEILRGSNMPDSVKAAMKSGELTPSQDFVDIVLPFLSQSSLADKPLILSSLGRWHGEEDGVLQALRDAHHPLKAAVSLIVTHDDVRSRWRAHEQLKDRSDRLDDAEHILDTRFEEFADKTMPVIDYYRDLGLLIEIDATKSREEVTTTILEQLAERAQR